MKAATEGLCHVPLFFHVLLEGSLSGGEGLGGDLREEVGRNVLPALGKGGLEDSHLLLQVSILNLQMGGLLSLSLARVVSGGAVALDAFDAALLLLVGRLCPLTGTEAGGWFWERLAP